MAETHSEAIKKIPVERLRPGMYIHDLGLDWLSHPFLRSRFVLRRDEEVAEILRAGVKELYIDTARGDDDVEGASAVEVRAEVDRELGELAADPPAVSGIPIGEELERAREIHRRAGEVVHDLMRDARLGRAIECGAVETLVAEITESLTRNAGALLSLLNLKRQDDYTFLHCVSVGTLMVSFGRFLKLPEETVRQAGIGGLVHDVGKSKIPLAILNKPDRLTDREFAVIKTHPRTGYSMLLNSRGFGDVPLDVALHHHERIDGTGYPDRLPAERISVIAQMGAICDVYDAITSNRCYHAAIPPTEALRKIVEWSKHQFRRDLVHSFIRSIGIYPVGTLVRLESGRLGVVIDQNANHLLTPVVRVVYDTVRGETLTPAKVDLSAPVGAGGADRIVSDESPSRWQIDPMQVLAEAVD